MEYLRSGAAKLGIELNPQQLEQFQVYYQKLLEWNQRINLTSITDFKEVQLKHFLDSLTVIPVFKQSIINKGLSVIDIGSGAGFPGLPLKIALPNIKLVLLEATKKKTNFLNTLILKLNLNDVEPLTGRAEEMAHQPQYRQRFYIVLSRAVATLPVLAELTLPFCAIGGQIIIQKKGYIKGEVNNSAKAIELMGGNQPEIREVEMPEFINDRYLVTIDKVSLTPAKYPRRSGIPIKRPII
ncbi:MAG: 16S rRNA (guanine(527)-N(7))-methyltransferase RsmG [Dehalococcoidia bacterium]|nr:MAG: 16S rRNA (guanine(527)-N(7))-methyltransferase RsmG [Dehalococcoidia bacterium]